MTSGENPMSATRLTPATRQPNPMMEAMTDGMSTFGRVVSIGVMKNAAVQMMAAMATMANSAKITRQENAPISRPDRVGPITGANMMTRPATPLAAPIFIGGNTRMMAAYMVGSTMPVPTPWMMRPASTSGKIGATADSIEPARKQASATSTRVFALTHLSRKPTHGSTTPMASM